MPGLSRCLVTDASRRNDAITCQPLPGIPGIPTATSEDPVAAAARGGYGRGRRFSSLVRLPGPIR
ncbi:hypothetical protein Arub01_32600 [Actinomadura rubrobrunea]|uniref:Uncharacterized protein n=1 Tax=Actinomadura rubrobrunea TaxID=115335 RepID=A0A9W6PXY8_9ACTN|nr:hypothetical protein Arub01_32600 [Actinomadura rubrobrunea]